MGAGAGPVRRLHEPDRLRFAEHGAQRYPGVVALKLDGICAALAAVPPDRAGVRLHGERHLDPLLAADGPVGAVAANVLGRESRPVRAILFNKTAETNWALGWHQDRTICVERRIDIDGFGPWMTKQGLQHVAPPFAVLERMVTLRVHLDHVPADNAPLLVAPGSHRAGQVPERAVAEVVRRCGTCACLAEAGDVWLYATPILHASDAATKPRQRRVLQVDFATGALPGELHWLGV